ncbi:aldehyde dehydrogenase [Amycolatopsis sp. WQ 127309]|uniref:aldehyde dehydrogenase family protein n=1 Tax=Amycolatopsis sp. WQ 127309 TaxID=2932773 RepID=UPI001FF4E66F|nr:aldehyde dehydrogenase family protein [Amycolatopsis sp. WQ 127309]UOZ03457.1 aldehyde dehydrogenase family protein [Amycolatopsis sp. WQ 127309]
MSTDLGLQSHYPPLIGGKFRAITDASFPAVDAATGEQLATISRGGKAEVDAAVAAAKAAFPAWAATRPEDRAKLLLRVADWLEENAQRLTLIDAHDIGRTVFEIPQDYRSAIGQYRFFAAAILTHDGYNHAVPGGWAIAKREPFGVVGQIIPWNVPAIMASYKLAPALAAGNTVVLKPDENASLSTLELTRQLAEIFPPGVVNVVPGYGDEAGAALTAHPDVRKLAFTGSPQIGRLVAHAGAERLIPVSLELGGKSPNIVFPDIDDIDAVVDNATFASTFCNGQSCLAGTRLFLHDDIYPAFMEKLVKAYESIRIGSPLDPETRLGCLVSEKQGLRVLDYIESGTSQANLATGGSRVKVEGNDHGWFVEPTIFETSNDSRIAQEEIFGPVLSVIRWNDFDTMIEQANDVVYGLASGVYTSNLRNAMRTADRLQAGQVWVNQYVNLLDGSPFGGFKESGLGREVGKDALEMYTQLKSIMFAEQVPPPFYV